MATAIVAAVLISTASPAWATETLTLTPNHGQATASFTAIYETYPAPGDCRTGAQVVDFFWDNDRQANGAIMEQTGDYCRASMQITPPSTNNRVGIHQLRGDRHPYVGPITVYAKAQANYTIDPPPSASLSPSASPTKQTASSSGSATTSASASGSTTTTASPTAFTTPSSSPPGSPSATSTPLTTAAESNKGGSGRLVGLIAGAVVLAGLGGALLIRRWRSRATAA